MLNKPEREESWEKKKESNRKGSAMIRDVKNQREYWTGNGAIWLFGCLHELTFSCDEYVVN